MRKYTKRYRVFEQWPGRDGLGTTGAFCWLLAYLVASVSGCSDGRPPRVTVSGQVLIDGEPLTIGSVRFIPSGARPAGGNLDENGRFTLSCYGDEDGVVLGTHKVSVNSAEYLTSTTKKWHAPKKYANFRTTPLEEEITGSTDSLVINLSWDGGKPFVEKVRQ